MSAEPRKIVRLIQPEPVIEGAGVRLKRSIAGRALDYLDPFLLLDHFGSDNPRDYLAGFPMHPHRGIETVTYMLAGRVRHEDSLGNAGVIGAGDVQWMTSGRGILHEEMPQPADGQMGGFQLWVNLPARLKMTRPHYQEVPSGTIPEVQRLDGVCVRVIAGSFDGVAGPVTDIAADPTYLDISVPNDVAFVHPVAHGHTVFAYVFEGTGQFSPDRSQPVVAPQLIVFGDGDTIQVQAGPQGVRFLLVSGLPLGEPIARYGPFVMNTQAEIMQALEDLRNGTFVTAD
jgi:quercetin 2,3-dioxygenase